MRTITCGTLTLLGLCALTLGAVRGEMAGAGAQAGIPPEVVAGYVYAIVQADRTLYTTHVVERMEELGKALATEQWKKQEALPLPAQMLLMAGEEIKGQGTDLRIRLASLWPINKANGPADDFERVGLERVAKEPKRPYAGFITQEGKRVFKAIYADRAVTKACVECHNGHGLTGKPGLKLYDVMGGIVISFPSP
ncbi:MAG: DUF3365 domain-containing protein [Nitrospirota bacterium]|nr:DUF3365 domain-containing protein [Nitrospirota bacterium]MDE3049724.1 DUF3365 domain-containing protein [Nitrospirota bacterium]MDE3219260.1 DUF3365 domain-containing protein [Nitrospirota bacterium]